MSSFGPHLISGIIAGSIGSAILPITGHTPDHVILYGAPMLSGICGALTPDMDIKSKSSQCMYILFTGLALYLFYIGRLDLAFYTLLYSLIPQFFSHRGFIHSFIFGLISSIGLLSIMYFNFCDFATACTIAGTYLFGFIFHILLDES